MSSLGGFGIGRQIDDGYEFGCMKLWVGRGVHSSDNILTMGVKC